VKTIEKLEKREKLRVERHKRRMEFWDKHESKLIILTVILALVYLLFLYMKGLWPI